jgi:two-component system phosphate regulon sensor histidine kinase PhoR
MRKHLFIFTTFIVCAGLLSFFYISVFITHGNNENIARDIVLLIAIVLICLFLVRGVVRRILKPFYSIEENLRQLSEGVYSPRPLTGSYEEVDNIMKGINDIALVLQNNYNTLLEEKNKMSYILNNIGDGFLLVDEDANIAFVNDIVLDMFDVTPNIIGKKMNYLTNDNVLTNSVEDCVTESSSGSLDFALNGRIYLVTIKRLMDTVLTMVVLSDVTESRESAKRNEEFFTNASHELRTPLTAIKGFNELAVIYNKDEKIKSYIDAVSSESNRMISLIDDMMKLSELDNAKALKPIPISLAKSVDEVRKTISFAIAEKSIIFESSGDALIFAEPKHVYDIIKNLVENAMRYNKHSGKVTVTIDNNENFSRLTVSDNGIGMSPAEQTRIFERFYRVEKSRSIKNGGTGLGLAIVKHICSLYGWELSLKSKLGVGTEVIIKFGGIYSGKTSCSK